MGRFTVLADHLRENPFIPGFTLPATVLFLGMAPIVMQVKADPLTLIRSVWFHPLVVVPAVVLGASLATVTAYAPSPNPLLTYLGMCGCCLVFLPLLLVTIAFVFVTIYLLTLSPGPIRLIIVGLLNGVVYGLAGLVGGASVSYWLSWLVLQLRRFTVTVTITRKQ